MSNTQICRGVRGAACAEANTREAIISVSRTLLSSIVDANGIQQDDIASLFFTVTPDLDAAYPAVAARELGFGDVAMLCAQEIPVPDGPSQCIRVLIHWNTAVPQAELEHIYIGRAASLRPDRQWPRHADAKES